MDSPERQTHPTDSPNYIFIPLDAGEFKRRVESGFSDVYLTTVSIIQGIALSFLCEEVLQYKNGDALPLISSIPTIGYIIATFGTIVGVSFEYGWFVGTHRYSYKFIDTLIPYVIGFFEIGMVFNLGHTERWWLCAGLMYAGGVVAYINTFSHYTLHGFKDEEVYGMFRLNMKWSIIITGSGSLISLALFLIYRVLFLHIGSAIDVTLVAAYLSVLTILLRKNALFLRRVHRKLGIQE